MIATERSAIEAGDTPSLAAFRTLKGGGLDVFAVAGDPSWVEHARSEPPESITTLLSIQRAYRIFDGIALDLEPHTLPAWKSGTDKATLIENYLATLALIRSAAQRQNLSVLATVHPTYATIVPPRGGASVRERTAQAVDALERFGGESMRQLSGVGKPWWLGVSTHTGSPPGTSYATLPAEVSSRRSTRRRPRWRRGTARASAASPSRITATRSRC